MIFHVSQHTKKLAAKSKAIHRQFYPSAEETDEAKLEKKQFCSEDPLCEDEHMVVRGLVHKYGTRALLLLTLQCASYCRFCTRRRAVGDIKNGNLIRADIDKIVVYLNKHKKINEVILSGGDPLTHPDTLLYALKKLQKLNQIKVIRIGTRLPVVDPQHFPNELLRVIKQSRVPIYVMLHFEHPDEITEPTIKVVKKLRKAGAMLFCQTVFLKGVNDDADTLVRLFSRLIEIGVKPYYIFRCDEVQGLEHFLVDFDREIAIMTEVRKRVSGLAYPTYVIDTPDGNGKIPVPLEFWDFDRTSYKDFLDDPKKLKTKKTKKIKAKDEKRNILP